jgi:hypothetical protein
MQLNGMELKITPASFSDAMALEKAIGRALKGTKFTMPTIIQDGAGKVDLEKSDIDLVGVIDLVLGAAVSDEVETCLFSCAQTALLGTSKIDRDFFEKVEHRELYYPIMVEIIKVNVGPFFKGLASKFGALAGTSTSSPK